MLIFKIKECMKIHLIFFFFLFSSIIFSQVPDTLWTRIYGGSNNDVGFSIKQTNDNGFIMVGYTFSFGNGANDIYMIKSDSIGNVQWTKTFGGPGNEWASSVELTPDGGYLIWGHTTSYTPNGNYLIRKKKMVILCGLNY